MIMRCVIAVFNEYAWKHFVINENSLVVSLSRDDFHLNKQVDIKVFVDNEVIHFDEMNMVKFLLDEDGNDIKNTPLNKGELKIITSYMEELFVKLYEFNDWARLYSVNELMTISVGKSLKGNICLPNSTSVDDVHLLIERKSEYGILKIKGKKTCFLNGKAIRTMEVQKVYFGDYITIGNILVIYCNRYLAIWHLKNSYCIETVLVRLKELKNIEGIKLNSFEQFDKYYSPAPRNICHQDNTPIELDAPPAKKEMQKQSMFLTIGPSLLMSIPMSLGCIMYIYSSRNNSGAVNGAYMYTGLITAISSAVFGALFAFLNYRRSIKNVIEYERLRKKAYLEYLIKCDNELKERVRYNKSVLLRQYPSISEIFASNGKISVWNKNIGDDDYYSIRLGLGHIPFTVPITIPKDKFVMEQDKLSLLPKKFKRKYNRLRDVPICIDLFKGKWIGVISTCHTNLVNLLWVFSIMTCGNIAPDCVKIAILNSNLTFKYSEIDFLKWLPQFRDKEEHFICYDRDRVEEFLCDFNRIYRLPENKGIKWVILTDDSKIIPGYFCENDDIMLVLFANNFSDVPKGAVYVIQDDNEFRGIINISDNNLRQEVIFDTLNYNEANKCVRILASLNQKKDKASIPVPVKVTLPELFEADIFNEKYVCDNWNRNSTIESLRVPIGLSENNRLIFLDPHEKAHGPHGLVAGMTGSGKSELLQTFIISLAIRYSPRDVVFFLIDYKGGGMANLFKNLPHLAGSISNLSGNMIYRAMVSIRSENERRQKLFLDAKVNSIREYQKRYNSGYLQIPLPHMFIIIDEFAELKREQPEFMKELISVAQVGRSLGVHLILATQKPSGTVDDNILSNSRFRICLRVQDKQDSNDMLHKPDAAYIYWFENQGLFLDRF